MISLQTGCITGPVQREYKQSIAGISIANCVMAQVKYQNTRASLKGEMTKLGKRLLEANTDLHKFKDVSISVHDHGILLETLKTHQDMSQGNIKVFRGIVSIVEPEDSVGKEEEEKQIIRLKQPQSISI